MRRCPRNQSSRLHTEHSSRRCKHKHKVSATAAGEKSRRGRPAPTTVQPPPPDDGSGRLKDFRVPPVIAAPQLEVPEPEGEEEEDDEEDLHQYPDDDIRAEGGYTPFEELDWSDEDITHELSIHVDATRTKCFQIWEDRLNYLEWFNSIAQLIIHREDPDLASMFIFYQWANTPMIELYTTLSRFQVQRDEQILEESVDGMDFVAGVLFADAEGRSGTTVTLRLGYYLPEQLNEFVGALPVYGDVNDILEASMLRMKDFVENTDLKEIQQQREAERRQETLENDIDSRQFYATYGSDEEIYQEAREAATGYLAEMGVEQDEEEEEEEEESEAPDEGKETSEEEMTDEEIWADTPEYGPDEFTPVNEDFPPDYMSPVDDDLGEEAAEELDSTASELESWQPEQSGVDDERLMHEAAPQQTAAVAAASTRDEARASEQQAAADMSSMSQQNLGQFDEAQASRVSPETTLSVSDQDDSRQHLDENGAHSPHSTVQQPSGTDPAQVDQEAAVAKPKKRAGQPKKTDGTSTPKKKPGRRKKAVSDTGDTTA